MTTKCENCGRDIDQEAIDNGQCECGEGIPTPDGVEVSCAEYEILRSARRLVETISVMTLNGECPACMEDGSKPNPECGGRPPEHGGFEMTAEDSIETLTSLITTARRITKQQPVGPDPATMFAGDDYDRVKPETQRRIDAGLSRFAPSDGGRAQLERQMQAYRYNNQLLRIDRVDPDLPLSTIVPLAVALDRLQELGLIQEEV